ncbi:hypothetical protein ACQCVE_05985 [Metabacillus sp. 113a]|uniref:hypothetical protein n=1 Tax=Metabacillus sp. 113a TaxID=3404706 RepID=UPI003CED4C5C
MKTNRIFSMLLIAVLLIYGLITPLNLAAASGGEQVIVPAADKQTELLNKVASKGKLQVIVRLNESFSVEGSLSADDKLEQRDRIQQVQDETIGELDTLSRAEKKSVKTFDTVPYLYVEVDLETLKNLYNSPNVVDIVEDQILENEESQLDLDSPQLYETGSTGTVLALPFRYIFFLSINLNLPE